MSVHGIRGIPFLFFEDYFSQRLQQVQCHIVGLKEYPDPRSKLGPLLFLIYINDLRNATKSLKLLLFADDTNAFCDNYSLNVLENIITMELNRLAEWFLILRHHVISYFRHLTNEGAITL